MPQALAVDVKNLKKKYRGAENWSVNDLSFSVNEGAIFGLLGPNGAGKTSTLSMITGLREPTEGSIAIFGKDRHDHWHDTQRTVGLVPQDIALYPSLTAYENLIYYARMYGVQEKQAQEEIANWLEKFGLYKVRNKRIQTYSGGMKRRINLLAGLLHHPTLLILDEPTVGTDVQSRNAIIEFLQELHKEGMTILYTSHHLDEAQDICTDIAIIDEGRMVISGKPATLIQEHPGATDLESLFLLITGKKLRD